MTKEQLQKQIERLLENPAFGENVVYIDSGLNEFPIRAFVYRNGVSSNQVRFDRGTEGRSPKYEIEIRISNSPEKGRNRIVTKLDSVMVAKRQGGELQKMRVMEITESDPGSWKLGLVV
jgi:hypothetical protein